MDALIVERLNEKTGTVERRLFRPVVRRALAGIIEPGDSNTLLTLSDGDNGDVIEVANAFGQRTWARVTSMHGPIEALSEVVVCGFDECEVK